MELDSAEGCLPAGFNSAVCMEIAFRDDEALLDSLIDLAMCLDNIVQDTHRKSISSTLMPSMSEPELMQLGTTCLSTSNLSVLVRSPRSMHTSHGGASKPQPTLVSTATYVSIPPFIVEAQILHSDQHVVISTMIDSGSSGHHHTAVTLQLPLLHLNNPLQISTINGSLIEKGTIQLCTKSVILQISSHHFEEISLLITNTPKYPIILGIPWLQTHDFQISWTQHGIIKCSSMSFGSPGSAVQVNIPDEYITFKDVFSKAKANGLPPHQTYDGVIDLLPNIMPP